MNNSSTNKKLLSILLNEYNLQYNEQILGYLEIFVVMFAEKLIRKCLQNLNREQNLTNIIWEQNLKFNKQAVLQNMSQSFKSKIKKKRLINVSEDESLTSQTVHLYNKLGLEHMIMNQNIQLGIEESSQIQNQNNDQ